MNYLEKAKNYMEEGDLSNAADCFFKDIEQGSDSSFSVVTLAFIHKFNMEDTFSINDFKKTVAMYEKCVRTNGANMPNVMIRLGLIYLTGQYGDYIMTPDILKGDTLIAEGIKRIGNADNIDPRICDELGGAYTEIRKSGDKNHKIKSLKNAIKYYNMISDDDWNKLFRGEMEKSTVVDALKNELNAL